MPQEYTALLEHTSAIDAPPERVWELVSDLSRMPEWSPQVLSTRLAAAEGRASVALGDRFTNLNIHGELKWTTHGQVVRLTPKQEIAFRITENWVIWCFQLRPSGERGTLLTQRRETPDGISELSLELTDGFMGGQEAFTETLNVGMRETLAQIKGAAEARVVS